MIPRLFLFLRLCCLFNFNIVLLGEVANGFRVGKLLHLHQKSDGITAFSATKVLPDLLYRRYHKTGSAFTGERT